MASLLLAYDTESDNCLAAIKKIVHVHEKYGVPGTFFLVARLLKAQGHEYKALLKGHPLFEIASHSMTHLLLKAHRWCGEAGPAEQFPAEIKGSKEELEDLFECPIKGFRSPVGWPDGLSGERYLLGLVREAGYEYTSSASWGENTTLPAPIRDYFTYTDDGFPELIEFPLHGWHENVAKGQTRISLDKLQPEGPHPLPELKLTKALKTPADEIEMNRKLMQAGLGMNAPYVTPIWHPWSLDKFDPAMDMVHGVIQAAQELKIKTHTFSGYMASHCIPAEQVSI
jgi:peptidoglycan/xylan/chitin deacetylase (PgdA/CDA1 family)